MPASRDIGSHLLVSGLVLCFLLLLRPECARGQERRRPRRPAGPEEGVQVPPGLRYADIRLGPFFLQPRVTVRDVGWDSNITGRSEAQGEASDFRATLSPGVKIILPIRDRHVISGDGQLDYLWFKGATGLRSFNGAATARYEYRSERWSLGLSDRFVNAERSQFDVLQIGDEDVPPVFEVFDRTRQLTNQTAVDLRWNFTSPIFLDARGARRIVRFDEEDEVATFNLAERLDRTEETIGGAVGFRLTSLMAVSLMGDWQRADYETPGNPREAETYRVGARIEMDPVGRISGDVVIGFRDQAPRAADVEAFSGIVVEGAVAVRFGGFMQVRVSGQRDAIPSFWFDSIFFLRQGAGISALVQGSRSLAFGGDVSLYEHDYPTEATRVQPDGSVLAAERLDRILNFGGRVRWAVSPANDVSFRVGWTQRDSNFDRQDVEGLVVGSDYSVVF